MNRELFRDDFAEEVCDIYRKSVMHWTWTEAVSNEILINGKLEIQLHSALFIQEEDTIIEIQGHQFF